ncbi:MAG: hypothetical protein AB9869_07185 [Verrucomicrobiia bacterium]
MKELPEEKESLWRLIVSPTVWAVHFLLCYITAAIWCAKRGADATLFGVRIAIAVYTVLAIAVVAWNGWDGYRRHRLGNAKLPHDFDSPEDRHRFLGFATLLLALLSGVAILYAAMVAIFLWNCH